MILFASIAILDPAALDIFTHLLHLDCVSNEFCIVLSEETV